MAKLNLFLSRKLILFITLLAATCGFVIGLNWSVNQSAQQMARVTDATPQTSPLKPIRHEIASTLMSKGAGKHSVKGSQENESLSASAKQDTGTTQSQSLKPDIPREDITPSRQAVNSLAVDVASSQISVREPLIKTFSVPTEFQAKVADRVKLVGSEKAIALTFDDGPGPYNTLEVLDILRENKIKATFFWVGQAVHDYPQIAKKVVADGHAIGNHTWHHQYRHLDRATAVHEIDDTAEVIYKTTGVTTALFRPPGGLLNNGVADYAKEKKYAVVMWSVDPMDYRPLKAQQLVNNVIRKAQPGTMVLMHDGGGNHPETVKALPQIISKLKDLGYRFVTVPELLAMKEIEQPEIIAKKQLRDSPRSPTTKP